MLVSILMATVFSTVTANSAPVIDYTYTRTTFYTSSQTSNDLLEDHYAVVVGISVYADSVNNLPSPAMAATEMRDTLCSNGWSSDNILLLTNEQATRQGILDALDWLSDKTGTVMFYFSGHGSQVKDTSGDEAGIDFIDEAIVPYECSKSTLILDDELADIFAGFRAEEIVMIFISCFSGGMAEESNIVKEESFYRMPMEELKASNRVIIAACQEGLTTYEFPIFGQPVARYLGESFNGNADLNSDGKVTAEEAFEYTQPRAILSMATGLGYPIFVVEIIKAWLKGEVPFSIVVYTLTILGLTLPVPQLFDGDTSSDIVITELSSPVYTASASYAR